MEKLKLVEPNLENLTGGWVSKKPISFNETPLKKEVTENLKKQYEINDEAAQIEAGKILAYEIVKNTKDNKEKIIKNA